MALHLLVRSSTNCVTLDDLLGLMGSLLPTEGALCLRLIAAFRDSERLATARIGAHPSEVAKVLSRFVQAERDSEKDNPVPRDSAESITCILPKAGSQASTNSMQHQVSDAPHSQDGQEDTDGISPTTEAAARPSPLRCTKHSQPSRDSGEAGRLPTTVFRGAAGEAGRPPTTVSRGLALLDQSILSLPDCILAAEDWDDETVSLRDEANIVDNESADHHFVSENDSPTQLPWFPVDPGGLGLRARIFILFDESSKSLIGKVIMGITLVTLLVSTVAFMLEASPAFRTRPQKCFDLAEAGLTLTKVACEPQPDDWLFVVEAICVIIFTIEYGVRVFTVHAVPLGGTGPFKRTLRYALQPLNVIDFIAILPFWTNFVVHTLLDGDISELGFMSALRLIRVARLFKMARHCPGFGMFVDVLVMSGMPLMILCFFSMIISIVFASLIYYFEGTRFSVADEFTKGQEGAAPSFPTGVFVRKDQPLLNDEVTPYRSIPYALWWVYVTTTTVGYGDISPTTTSGKIIGVTCFYVGIIFMALPISVLGSNFETVYASMLQRKVPVKKGEVTNGSASSRKKTTRRTANKSASGCGENVVVPLFPEGDSFVVRIFVFLDNPQASRLGNKYSLVMLLVIMCSTVSFILESMPEFNATPADCTPEALTEENCRPQPLRSFYILECLSIGIFTVDYLARALTVHAATSEQCDALPAGPVTGWRKTVLYCTQALNIVDLLALAPFYAELAFGGGTGAAVLRVFRLVRIFRCLRMPKLRACADMFINVMADASPALLVLLVMTTLMSILLSTCIYFAEGQNYSVEHNLEEYPYGAYIRPTTDGHDMEVSPYTSIIYSLWWFFTTATTVGYGDDFPTTAAGRFVAVTTFYTGIVLLALPVTIVGGSFSKFYPDFVEEFGELQQQDKHAKRPQVKIGTAEFIARVVPVEESITPGDQVDAMTSIVTVS